MEGFASLTYCVCGPTSTNTSCRCHRAHLPRNKNTEKISSRNPCINPIYQRFLNACSSYMCTTCTQSLNFYHTVIYSHCVSWQLHVSFYSACTTRHGLQVTNRSRATIYKWTNLLFTAWLLDLDVLLCIDTPSVLYATNHQLTLKCLGFSINIYTCNGSLVTQAWH